MPISLFMLISESDESDRLDTSINDDAREGHEQARIRYGSLNSDESTQLILPQNAPLSPSSSVKKDEVDAS